MTPEQIAKFKEAYIGDFVDITANASGLNTHYEDAEEMWKQSELYFLLTYHMEENKE